MHEQGMIRPSADHADLGAIVGIPAGKCIDHVQSFASIQIVDRAFTVDFKCIVVDRHIHRTPPDVVLRIRMLDNPFVFGRASGLVTRERDQRARIGDVAFVIFADRRQIERRGRMISPHVLHVNAVRTEIKRAARWGDGSRRGCSKRHGVSGHDTKSFDRGSENG